MKDPNDPKENDPLNRSVRVSIELVTTEHGQMGISRAPERVAALTRFWDGRVESLIGAAAGVAVYHLTLVLRNTLSGKSATYKGELYGGGIAMFSRDNPKATGGRFSFSADSEMGFDDFSGQVVRVEKASATLGVKASVAYLSFVFLGSGASLIPFEKKLSVGLKPNVAAFVASGTIQLKGANPGDWIDVDGGTADIPYSVERHSGDSLVVSFPTGKSAMGDLSAQQRSNLVDFVKRWARQF